MQAGNITMLKYPTDIPGTVCKTFPHGLKAKPAMVMTAFNAIDRKPISGNKELLRDLLRDKEGFDGTVISDWVPSDSWKNRVWQRYG